MKLYIRLQQLLDEHGLKVADIVNEYPEELSEFKVKHLMDDHAKEITRDVLEKVCNFLIKRKLVDRGDLPDILFSHSPERFWNLLFERSRVTLCMGTRPDQDYRDHVVVAADSMLQASLLKRMTEAGIQSTSGNSTQSGKRRQKKISPQVIDARLVRTWKKKKLRKKEDTDWSAKVREEATQCYHEFLHQQEKNTALVCFGSIKSNPIIEKVFENSFMQSVAFESQDACNDPRDRTCPFLLVYRGYDPDPASLCGGKKLCKDSGELAPGIYYETSNGSWLSVPWSREAGKDEQGNDIEMGQETALVYYRFEHKIPRLQLVMGGFSGQGTRCLAEFLENHQLEVDKLWPPTVSNEHHDMGAFIIRFDVIGQRREGGGLPVQYRTVNDPEVIRIPKEALERRLVAAA